MTVAAKREHVPNRAKLPEPLRGLPWQAVSEITYWTDGDQILAAVPVCDSRHKPDGRWGYELSVVVCHCD